MSDAASSYFISFIVRRGYTTGKQRTKFKILARVEQTENKQRAWSSASSTLDRSIDFRTASGSNFALPRRPISTSAIVIADDDDDDADVAPDRRAMNDAGISDSLTRLRVCMSLSFVVVNNNEQR